MPATAIDPKTALVVIDLQMGLMKYPTIHPMTEVVKNTARLADAFRAKGLPVVLVTVAFSPDGGDRVTTRNEQPARALPSDPEFFRITPELGPQTNDLLIVKKQPGAFYGTGLDMHLRRRGVTGIVLTGISTSNGVDSTARGAHERGYNLTFASDAITDVDPLAHDFVTKKIFPRLGETDTTEAILALLA